MPKTIMAVPATQQAIVRPLAKQVAIYLINKLGLPTDIILQLVGDTGEMPNEPFDLTCKDERVRFSPESRIQFSFRETEGSAQTVMSRRVLTDYMPVFYDPYRDISLHVVRDQVRLEFELDITFPTRVEAMRIYERLKTYAYTMEAEDTHTFEYSYTLPENAILLLIEAHKKIQASKAPEYEHFKDYFDRYKLHETLVLGKLNGGQDHFALHEKQHDVLGWFDFTTPPAPQPAGDGTGTWRCTMNYSVTYSKPIQFYLRWPLLINNQLIDERYLPVHYTHHNEFDVKTSLTRESLSDIAYREQVAPPYLILPEVDDWYQPPITSYAVYFMSSIFTLNDDNTATIDLSTLGEWSLSKYLMEYLGHLGTRAYSDDSILTLEFYENNELIFPKYTVKKGVIIITEPLDIRMMYRVRLGVKTEWRSLNTDTLEGLRRYPHLFVELLTFLGVYEQVKNDVGISVIGKGHHRVFDPNYPGEGYHTTEMSFDPNDMLSPFNPNSPNWYLNPTSPYYYKNPGSPFYGIDVDDPLSPFNPNGVNYYLNPTSPYYYKNEDSPFCHPSPTDPFWKDYGYNWVYDFMDWDSQQGIISKETLERAKDYLDRFSNDFTKEQSGIMALVLTSHLIARNERSAP